MMKPGMEIMNQRDQELLDKQLRAIAPAPPRNGLLMLAAVLVFVAGMTLSGLLAGDKVQPENAVQQHDSWTGYSSGSVVKNNG